MFLKKKKKKQYVSHYFVALDMTEREGQSSANAESKPWTASKG
jgi:2-keto-4-pentenoate hydratase/2-oxohepta-3-ene-1,7-dioic acid hydratase in catechol pathway